MRLLALSDLHGCLEKAHQAIDGFSPDAILCCGDWGDSDQVSREQMKELIERVPVYTTFGNHDPIELLRSLENRDGSPILVDEREAHTLGALRLAGIGGIWAKNCSKPHHVSDEAVQRRAREIAQGGAVDVLLTHGCPAGHADLMLTGQRGGQRCFLEAFRTIRPRLHLCGHLHVPQERILKDGRRVINVGLSAQGDAVLIEHRDGVLHARRESLTVCTS